MCVFLRTPKARTKSLCSRKLRLTRRSSALEHRILHAGVSTPQRRVWTRCSSLCWVGESAIVLGSASSKEAALPLVEMDEPKGGTVPRGGCGDQGETWEVSGP